MTKLSRQIIPCQRTFPVRRNYSNAEIMVIDLVGNNGNTRLCIGWAVGFRPPSPSPPPPPLLFNAYFSNPHTHFTPPFNVHTSAEVLVLL